jgi:hypothetical protein
MAVRTRSVIPQLLSGELAAFGEKLESGPSDRELESVLTGLSALPAQMIVRASREIATAISWPRPRERFSLRRFFRKPLSKLDLMKANPDCAWIFLFDYDGHVREASLNAIEKPPSSPFFFAALAWRLNDWVDEVRQAARKCAERVLMQTEASVAADAALCLMNRRLAWGRWNDERHALDGVFGRKDVIDTLANSIRETASGPMAKSLRHALRYPSMDEHLERLATDSVQPAVRAVAYQCLILRTATWVEGTKRMWVDKSYGIWKMVPKLGSRKISSERPIDQLITEAAHDQSTAVRRVAADALVETRAQTPNADELIERLAKDSSAAIRSVADYMLRHPLK